jgi:hypothetical protein
MVAKRRALTAVARRMAEYASLFRPTFCAHAAELRAPCSASSIHNFGGCAFIHKFCFFVKNFFHFCRRFVLLALLSEFSMEMFDRDFFAPFRLLTRL